MSAWRASRAKRLVLLYLYLYIGMAEIYTDPPMYGNQSYGLFHCGYAP